MNIARLQALLNRRHAPQKDFVVGLAVTTRMNSAVTVRTEADDKCRMIWSAVAHAPNVVGLQIGRTVRAQKRRGLRAPLTFASSTGQDIVSNVSASLIDRTGLGALDRRANACRFISSLLERGHRVENRVDSLNLLHDALDMAQSENYHLANVTIHVATFTPFVAFADHFTHEDHVPLGIALVKHQQRSSVGHMIAKGLVPSRILLITALSLAEVKDSAILQHFVIVAVFGATSARHYEDEVVARSRDDAGLLTAPKFGVDILAAVVRPPLFEPVTHSAPQALVPEDATCPLQDSPYERVPS